MNVLDASRVDRLMRLFEAGVSARGAAALAGVSRKAACRYRRQWQTSRAAGAHALLLRLPASTDAALSREAARRGLAPPELAGRLLSAIVEARLTAAVIG